MAARYHTRGDQLLASNYEQIFTMPTRRNSIRAITHVAGELRPLKDELQDVLEGASSPPMILRGPRGYIRREEIQLPGHRSN